MMQKKFEFENEVIEEELYQFSEAETERIFKEKAWSKEYAHDYYRLTYFLVRTTSSE